MPTPSVNYIGADDIELTLGVETEPLSRTAAETLVQDLQGALILSSTEMPSGCSIEKVGANAVLTLGANPRTFTPNEFDRLLVNLQNIRGQL